MAQVKFQVKTARELNDSKYTLIQNDTELQSIIEYARIPKQWQPDITGAIVLAGSPFYSEIWFTENSAWYSLDAIYRTPEFYVESINYVTPPPPPPVKKHGRIVEGTTIVTNNQSRELIDWADLTDKEKKEFDYLDTLERQDNASFFRYKDNVYDIGEFERVTGHKAFAGWDGCTFQTYSSGVLVKYDVDDNNRVIVAYFYS